MGKGKNHEPRERLVHLLVFSDITIQSFLSLSKYSSLAQTPRAHLADTHTLQVRLSNTEHAHSQSRLLLVTGHYTFPGRLSCLSPSNSIWKAGLDDFVVFPGHRCSRNVLPFDEHLWNSVIPLLHETMIQNFLWCQITNRQVQHFGQLLEHRCVVRCIRLQLGNMEHRVDQASSR